VGPVVVFLPAADEAATVATVLGRVPASVCGRPVRRLVIDDGSTDGTGALASAAGAEVVRLEPRRGLGAAARRGLAEAVDRGAEVVAFCDADGEYDPAELARLVGPVLEGRADYVVGSRFAGERRRMLPHRRAGNALLTLALSIVARRRIGDGQSGFRALSAPAAAAAEIVHDYNYAQVLTLDLLAKGFRYLEVPISYDRRRHGRSFVRPGRYLRAVAPAIVREVRSAGRGAPRVRARRPLHGPGRRRGPRSGGGRPALPDRGGAPGRPPADGHRGRAAPRRQGPRAPLSTWASISGGPVAHTVDLRSY